MLHFNKVPLNLRTAIGCQLAEMMARQALRNLHARDPGSAIQLLDGALNLVGELELDADDPSFEHQSCRVREIHDKVRIRMLCYDQISCELWLTNLRTALMRE